MSRCWKSSVDLQYGHLLSSKVSGHLPWRARWLLRLSQLWTILDRFDSLSRLGRRARCANASHSMFDQTGSDQLYFF